MFYGREAELKTINELYRRNRGQLVVVYGRRRIGKSTLIKHFSENKPTLSFEGLERQSTATQIEHVTQSLRRHLKNNRLLQNAEFKTWSDLFDFLTEHLASASSTKKIVLVFDEFQWLAASQSKLVSLLKFYWDNHWKNLNVMLILCGSIASFMVKKVIHSKALYGRVDLSMCIDKLIPKDARKMLRRRSESEVLKYLMILGGVPKYLEFIDQSKSFQQNIEKMFFDRNALLDGEFERIFYSHYREPGFYLKIIRILLDGPKSLSELSKKLDVPSGGGMSSYLENLELAGFIRIETPFLSQPGTKIRKYKIADEYLMFFSKFLKKNEKSIRSGAGTALFRNKILKTWDPWLGLAFESYCSANAMILASAMGFDEKVVSYGPMFERGVSGYQIDLLFERSDSVITLCEIKYYNKPVGPSIIPEVLRKAKCLKLPRGYTLEFALIAPLGAEQSLKDADFFHHVVNEADIFH